MCASMNATSGPGEHCATYAAVPLAGLVAQDGLPFPLYLRTSSLAWVLYKPEGTLLDQVEVLQGPLSPANEIVLAGPMQPGALLSDEHWVKASPER